MLNYGTATTVRKYDKPNRELKSLFRCSSVSGPHISQLGYLCGAKKATGWYNSNFLNEKNQTLKINVQTN